MKNRKRSLRPRNAAPQTTGDLVGKYLAKIGGEDRAIEQRVFSCYEAAVGAMFRNKAEPDALRGRTLFVRVSSSALAHEVTMLRRDILARMAATLGPDLVTDIRTRVT